MRPIKDFAIAGFVVFSAITVVVRAFTRDHLINEAESAPSEMAETMKATPGLRVIILIVAIFICGVAIWTIFKP